MYDSLSNHDYDNSQESGKFSSERIPIKSVFLDFIANVKSSHSSSQSSSRSSGIYSTNDPHLFSSSSSEFCTNNKFLSSSKQIIHLFY
jgi:hypothetical protein